MAEVFPKKQSFDSQWKKIAKKYNAAGVVEKCLAVVDAGVKPKDYDREDFTKRVMGNNAKSDVERFKSGLEENKKKVDKLLDDDDLKLTSEERKFLGALSTELHAEAMLWKARLTKM